LLPTIAARAVNVGPINQFSLFHQIASCFHSFDWNSDGTLDAQEFHTLISHTLCKSRSMIKQFFDRFAAGQVEGECVELFALQPKEVDQVAKDAFKSIDTRGIGQISFSQFEAFAKRELMMIDLFATHERIFGDIGE